MGRDDDSAGRLLETGAGAVGASMPDNGARRRAGNAGDGHESATGTHMLERRHPLIAPTPGTARELLSLHYGPADRGRKAVIQAALHADEVPGLLVAHHLRGRLAALEARGQLQGEVVLVPYANPVGLSQRVLQAFEGRFDLASGENFNRRYANLAPRAAELLAPRCAGGQTPDVTQVRAALRQAWAETAAATELESLRRTLLGLAIDADLVLDLHCDNEAVLHLYTAPQLWPEVEPLARLMRARAVLLAEAGGGAPFDEACSMVWPGIAAALAGRLGRPVQLPPACVAVTVELRGETDVRHELAASDAGQLLDYLAVRGYLAGAPVELPPPECEPTPLAGSIPVVTPHGGIVVYLRELGARLRQGEPLLEIVDPATGGVSALACPVDGVFYARESRRYVLAGTSVAKVAGREAVRSGHLLSD
jgi:predicted deacylase